MTEGIEGEFIQTKTLQQSHFYVIWNKLQLAYGYMEAKKIFRLRRAFLPGSVPPRIIQIPPQISGV